MFDLNPENWPPIHIKLVHSSISYPWAIYQNMIRVVKNRLVGMGL